VTRPGTRRRPAGGAGAGRPGESAAADAAAEVPASPLPAAVYRRRRRLGLLLLGLVLLVGLGLTARVLLYDVGLADVDRVDVTLTTATGAPVGDGAAVVSEQQLRDAAAVPLGGPLVSVDTAGIADRLRAVPAVASVDVERDWPNAVAVHVVQRTPVAAVQTAGGPALVDATGAVFPGPAVPGLPGLAVASPGPADPATAAAVAVLAALPDALRGQVLTATSAVAPGGGLPQVVLGLTDSREVHWGSAERSTDKAAVLVPLLSQPGRIYDVTSPDLPTIKR
jgi:cell division protein FtsQ